MTNPLRSLWPDHETCAVCLHVRGGAELARSHLPFVPGQTHDAVWVCRDFHVCAGLIHACASRLHSEHKPMHTHLAKQVQVVSDDQPTVAFHFRMARMREFRATLGIPEPEPDMNSG